MIKFLANLYLVKGKIFELETCTLEGRENDITLEKQEKNIIPVLQSLLNKNPEVKKDKKSVWFVELDECKWLESGNFKNFDKTQILLHKTDYTASSFKKASASFKRIDAKILATSDEKLDCVFESVNQ